MDNQYVLDVSVFKHQKNYTLVFVGILHKASLLLVNKFVCHNPYSLLYNIIFINWTNQFLHFYTSVQENEIFWKVPIASLLSSSSLQIVALLQYEALTQTFQSSLFTTFYTLNLLMAYSCWIMIMFWYYLLHQ